MRQIYDDVIQLNNWLSRRKSLVLKTVFAHGITELSLDEHNVRLLLHSKLIFKKHVEPSPLFLPHLQLLLHCTFKQDFLIPIRCLKPTGCVQNPRERSGSPGRAAHGSGGSSHCAVCSRARILIPRGNPRVRKLSLCFSQS